MNIKRPLRHLVWASMAFSSFLLLGCGGCASQEQPKPAKNRDIVWKLSPDAQATYAYLLYDQSLRQEDEEGMLEALKALRVFNPPASVYIETSVWLMGRKSPVAEKILQQGLQAFPHNTSLHLLYAELLQSDGHTDKAMEMISRFIAEHPDDIDAKLEYALLLVKGGKHAEAERILQSIKGAKRTALVEYYHARALIGMNRDSDAIPFLRKAIAQQTNFVEAMAELAYIYEQNKEFAKARHLYEKILQLEDTSPEVLLRLVALSLRLNQPAKALEFMQKGPESMNFLTTAAGMFVEARQYDYAAKVLASVANRADASDDVFFYLAAVAYEGNKDVEQALQWLGRIKTDSPHYAKAVLLRAQMLLEQDKGDNALALLHEARVATPDQKTFWDMEIRLTLSQKGMQDAAALACEAYSRFTGDPDLGFMYASLLDELQDKARAMEVMEQILRDNPDNFKAMNYVGYTLAEENRDLPRALRLLEKAVELSPDSDYIWDSLAWAQFRAGRHDAAWASISKAVSINETSDPTIWEHYGDIAVANGQKEEARKAYSKALEASPDNARSLQKKLGGL